MTLDTHACAEQTNIQGHLRWSQLKAQACRIRPQTGKKLESGPWQRDVREKRGSCLSSSMLVRGTPCYHPGVPCSPHPAAHCSESRLLRSRSRPLCRRSKSWGCTSRLGRQSNWLDTWASSRLVCEGNVGKGGGADASCLLATQNHLTPKDSPPKALCDPASISALQHPPCRSCAGKG